MSAKEAPAKIELTDEKKEELKALGITFAKRAAFAVAGTIVVAAAINLIQNRSENPTDEDAQS